MAVELHAKYETLASHESRGGSKVTVAVSLFNYRDYVVSCLESVTWQTLEDLDLVVVDDCSTDGGTDVVLRWLGVHGGRFGRWALLRHQENSGLAAARNTGFAHARTEHVFVLDADNLLYPRCLEQLGKALAHCDASFAYCYHEKFGAATGLLNLRPWNPDSLRHGNTIDAMVLLRRSVWEAVGGYSRNLPVMGWEDFDLWIKISRMSGWGVQVPETLGRYYVHQDSMLWTVTNPRAHELWDYLRSTYPDFFQSSSCSS
jgi:glycosyltransferase involved in cell wall biosynthesis